MWTSFSDFRFDLDLYCSFKCLYLENYVYQASSHYWIVIRNHIWFLSRLQSSATLRYHSVGVGVGTRWFPFNNSKNISCILLKLGRATCHINLQVKFDIARSHFQDGRLAAIFVISDFFAILQGEIQVHFCVTYLEIVTLVYLMMFVSGLVLY